MEGKAVWDGKHSSRNPGHDTACCVWGLQELHVLVPDGEQELVHASEKALILSSTRRINLRKRLNDDVVAGPAIVGRRIGKSVAPGVSR